MQRSSSLHYSTQRLVIKPMNQGYHFIFCIHLFDSLMKDVVFFTPSRLDVAPCYSIKVNLPQGGC